MTRLVVISNRVNVPSPEEKGVAGGLAMALTAALRQYQGVWFGWSGEVTEEFSGQIAMRREGGITTATIDLEQADVEEYYNGYANTALWPLFHYRVDLTAYDRTFDAGYARVNERFAETVRPLIEKDDLVWVHDYHLIPCAAALRRRDVKNTIGFFLHIPWPPRQLLTTLPNHRELVEAMFAYDLVGFQTREWLDAFVDYVTQEAGGLVLADGRLSCFGRAVRAEAFPIGIDAKEFTEMTRAPAAEEAVRRMRATLRGRDLIFGVDRLDYAKGIEERFRAYESLLERAPERAGRTVMVQVAPPSREAVSAYQDIRETLDALAGHINGRFADFDWTPLRYVNRSYPREMLAGMFRVARVAFVTPLRDGMNLVAKEFVAAQDPDDPGALVLSRFAGAAEQLKDALLVNPMDHDSMVDALAAALAMPLAERRRRYEAMIGTVLDEDVIWWRERFVAALKSTASGSNGLRAVS